MKLSELREKRDHVRETLSGVFTEAKTDDGGYDFNRVKSLDVGEHEGDKSVRVADLIAQKNRELDEVSAQVEQLEAAEKAAEAHAKAEKEPARQPVHPTGEAKDRDMRSLGEKLTQDPIYSEWLKGRRDGRIVIDGGLKEVKADFTTSAGWAPDVSRTGIVVDAPSRPIQLLDIIPSAQTGQSSVAYMEETTRTHASAETAEGGLKPESSFELTEKTSPVTEIADSIPVTDVQLEDVSMVASFLEGRLRFGIRQRLDGQVINGNGMSPNLTGILNVTGIQTQAKGTDPTPDAVFKAGTKLRVTGRVQPTHVVFHPNDWQQIRLLRDSNGNYIWGSPSEQGPERIWGWPVVQSDAITEGTALLGSFETSWISMFERRGIVIERGFVGDDFRRNKQTLRASMRTAFVVFRPSAMATVTGI